MSRRWTETPGSSARFGGGTLPLGDAYVAGF